MENLSQLVELEANAREKEISIKIEKNKMYLNTVQIKNITTNLKICYNELVDVLTDDITSLRDIINRLQARDNTCNKFNITTELKKLKKVETIMECVDLDMNELYEGSQDLNTETEYHLKFVYDSLIDSYTKIMYPNENVDIDANEMLCNITQLENTNPTYLEFTPITITEIFDLINLFPKEQHQHLRSVCLENEFSSSARNIFSNLNDCDYTHIDTYLSDINRSINLLRNAICNIWYNYRICKSVDKEKRFDIKTEMKILNTILEKLKSVRNDMVKLNNCITLAKKKSYEYLMFLNNMFVNYSLKTTAQRT